MKIVIRTVVLHIICILLFGSIYYGLTESFYYVNNKEKTILDFISLSVNIQSSGGGLTYLEPITYYSKIAVLIQQIILISFHVITLYIFTL